MSVPLTHTTSTFDLMAHIPNISDGKTIQMVNPLEDSQWDARI